MYSLIPLRSNALLWQVLFNYCHSKHAYSVNFSVCCEEIKFLQWRCTLVPQRFSLAHFPFLHICCAGSQKKYPWPFAGQLDRNANQLPESRWLDRRKRQHILYTILFITLLIYLWAKGGWSLWWSSLNDFRCARFFSSYLCAGALKGWNYCYFTAWTGMVDCASLQLVKMN